MKTKEEIIEELESETILVSRVEEKLDLPKGTIFQIYPQDDFSFFVKFTALIEGMLSRVITGRLFNPTVPKEDLGYIINHLNLGNVSAGKLRLAKALELLHPKDAEFIHFFAKIRNKLAHDGSQLLFDIATHVSLINERGRSAWVKQFKTSGIVGSQDEIFGEPIDVNMALSYPKEFLFAGIIDVLGAIEHGSLHITQFPGQDICISQDFDEIKYFPGRIMRKDAENSDGEDDEELD